jgi:citrate lyase beta subunit
LDAPNRALASCEHLTFGDGAAGKKAIAGSDAGAMTMMTTTGHAAAMRPMTTTIGRAGVTPTRTMMAAATGAAGGSAIRAVIPRLRDAAGIAGSPGFFAT